MKKAHVIMLLLLCLVGYSAFGQADSSSEEPNLINTEMLKKMTVAIENQTYPNVHSVLIHYKGNLVFEKYFSGKDESWGTDLGVVEHGENTLHDLRSLTKSIVSICFGLAIQNGFIENVEEKVFTYFPEYGDLNIGLHQEITLKHLLTMTSGLEWNEDLPYTNPKNSETAMVMSDDPIRYVLSRPLQESPGSVWNYNGGTTELLSVILHKATGLNIEEFAVEYLFKPLEIDTYYWTKAPGQEHPIAASGLRMLPSDILKIGVVLLQDGYYKGEELLNKQWVEESFTSHVKRGKNGGYGYQFWIDQSPDGKEPNKLVTAVGNGDQRIYLDKSKQLVVVTTAGNYNIWDLEKGSFQLLTDFIYPALEK
ncbi:serine hydrolase [Algoriphagus sp. Y33]|uniref:serine hydrolase domain-containing protein n=1 Tax=Algoriphagus sp. Y33 TaxID=2772483 RepID=UPI00177D2EB7|nr:serine hydrolase [Algoriphagus sp. Y33]